MGIALKESLPLPDLNTKMAQKILTAIIREEIHKTGMQKAVIGLSGGIDSAVSFVLAVMSLGSKNIIPILMPYITSSKESVEHAQMIADQWGVKAHTENITEMANAYFKEHPGMSKNRKGNILARIRMMVLYDHSSMHKALVLGTSNKSEILLGYTTLWGDMANALNPLGDLYKSQVRKLAEHLGIPKEIIQKPPSADLWEGQTDENELNVSYDMIDRLLYQWVDLRRSIEDIVKDAGYLKLSRKIIDMIFTRVQKNQFKRKMPLIAKLSTYTIGREFRYPRDWGL